MVGSVIGGRLRIDRIIGAGGMGVVAAATHLELDQVVAVKWLQDELGANPTIVERFIREARAVAKLRTEHVCRVQDVGRLDSGAPYIVMELLAGSDLATAIAHKPLPSTTAVEYVLQACVALAEAHAAGIVHRDLKPANLFVTRRPDGGPLVKVLDFGIAKAFGEARLTATASAMGSPGYMSPEQLQSAHDVDVRTDIWALGVTLYQLLSQRLPFASAQLAEIAVKITTAAPDPIEVAPGLRAVILRCLEKSPDRRYPDVASLAADLVPFGGPSARHFATLVGQLSNKQQPTIAPPALASVAAPTAASFASSAAPITPNLASVAAPTAASFASSAAPIAPNPASIASSPAPRRSGTRALVIIVAAIALVGGGIAAWQLTRSPQADVANVPARDAAVRLATVVPDAAIAIDAAVGIDAAPVASIDPPIDARPADAPHDARSTKHDDDVPLDVAYARQPKMQQSFVQALKAADQMLKRNPGDQNALRIGVMSACYLGEPAKAQAYFSKLVGKERETLRSTCARNKIMLVDTK